MRGWPRRWGWKALPLAQKVLGRQAGVPCPLGRLSRQSLMPLHFWDVMPVYWQSALLTN